MTAATQGRRKIPSKRVQPPATGVIKRNTHPYEMGKGTVQKLASYMKAGLTVTFESVEEQDLGRGGIVTFFIFEVQGKRYGIKAEDVDFTN